MFKLILPVSVALCLIFCFCNCGAISSSIKIISVQLGDGISASNEFIEIFNDSEDDVDITNWCLYYASATNNSIGNKIKCFIPQTNNWHIILPSKKSSIVISSQLNANNPSFVNDGLFSSTLASSAGHVRLINDMGEEIDKLAWGQSAVSPEGGQSASVPSVGQILNRKNNEGLYIDTDNNQNDFEISVPLSSYEAGNIIDIFDICSNIIGVQEIMPEGFESDLNGGCEEIIVDICNNLDGIQDFLPDGYYFDQDGKCQPIDYCENMDGIQNKMPYGYHSDDKNCNRYLDHLTLSELYPNPVGIDDGFEYVEIYNPNNFDVELSGYKISVGSNKNEYDFPTDVVIKPNDYYVIYNNLINFTLTNLSGGIDLIDPDGNVVSSSLYSDAKEGESWSLIDTWQYSNRLTPGEPNTKSEMNDDLLINAENKNQLKPCEAGEYRNLETNRCRRISNASSILTPCKDGQYRSEETGRCRNIVNDVENLLPCPEGQERNPKTNRCRAIVSVLGINDLKSCPAGQERNPETNRCRNIKTISEVDYEPQKIDFKNDNSTFLFSFAGIGSMAIGYGVWEWRQELQRAIKLIATFMKLPI